MRCVFWPRALTHVGQRVLLVAGLALGQLSGRPAAAHAPLAEEIQDLTAIIERGPARGIDYLRRGELRRLQGDWRAAREDYDQAERLEPRLPTLELCRAALALDSGDPAGAKQTLDRFLGREPDQAEGLLLRARVEERLGRPADAVRDLDRAIARLERPTPDHYLLRARLQSSRGNRFLADALR